MSVEAAWHDLECGSYLEDCSLWDQLAGTSACARILDIGCGTGRVALRLAAAGHDVTGLDVDAVFLATLRERAADQHLTVETAEADVRSFDLGRLFDLVLAPMQLLQLFQSDHERHAALRCIRDHLEPGGRFATALLDLDGEVIDADYLAPPRDMREQDGWVFSSQATAIRTVDGGKAISLERLRQAVSPRGELREETSRIRLALVTPQRLEAEARAVGLEPREQRVIPATGDYMGSVAVIAERAR